MDKSIRCDLTAFACLLVGGASMAAATGVSATVAPSFFNPSLGQVARIDVTVPGPGDVDLEVLDREHVAVRRLSALAAQSRLPFEWDGRDAHGVVVPDEVYTLRVRFRSGGGEAIFDPSADPPAQAVALSTITYSRQDGVLGYSLPAPSRVHIQAGQARDAKDGGATHGPVLKTLVDRQPRSGGAVIEKWNGFDDSRAVFIPDLPDFKVAILAVPLPAASIITVGNRRESFVEYVARTRGAPSPRNLTKIAGSHHEGLNAFEDRSPQLTLTREGREDADEWTVSGQDSLAFDIRLHADDAPFFLTPAGRILVFLDGDQVASLPCVERSCRARLAPASIPRGRHRLAVNWSSSLGPVGVAVQWIERK
jgi:hypothetical protein